MTLARESRGLTHCTVVRGGGLNVHDLTLSLSVMVLPDGRVRGKHSARSGGAGRVTSVVVGAGAATGGDWRQVWTGGVAEWRRAVTGTHYS